MPESKVLLKYETDKSSLNKTIQDEQKLLKAQQRLADSAKDVNRAASDMFDDSTQEARRFGDELERVEQQARGMGDTLANELERADQAFSQTSKNVALAGDVNVYRISSLVQKELRS